MSAGCVFVLSGELWWMCARLLLLQPFWLSFPCAFLQKVEHIIHRQGHMLSSHSPPLHPHNAGCSVHSCQLVPVCLAVPITVGWFTFTGQSHMGLCPRCEHTQVAPLCYTSLSFKLLNCTFMQVWGYHWSIVCACVYIHVYVCMYIYTSIYTRLHLDAFSSQLLCLTKWICCPSVTNPLPNTFIAWKLFCSRHVRLISCLRSAVSHPH